MAGSPGDRLGVGIVRLLGMLCTRSVRVTILQSTPETKTRQYLTCLCSAAVSVLPCFALSNAKFFIALFTLPSADSPYEPHETRIQHVSSWCAHRRPTAASTDYDMCVQLIRENPIIHTIRQCTPNGNQLSLVERLNF